jgi:hypothetical protein
MHLQTDLDKPGAIKQVLDCIATVDDGLKWKIAVGEEVTIWYAEEFENCCCHTCMKKEDSVA